MDNIFLVFGYGVPKNISGDEKYNFYLKMVFNRIYGLFPESRKEKIVVIFCGGKTDCFRPYKRTEADEMKKLFTSLATKPNFRRITKDWKFLSEKRSISTLENFLFSKRMMQKIGMKDANVYIFCEETRNARIKKMSKIIFGSKHRTEVFPIDFDTSGNRHLDEAFIARKEREELKHSLRALKSKDNLKKHHRFFEEKLKLIRQDKSQNHEDLIKKWWEKQIKNSKKINKAGI